VEDRGNHGGDAGGFALVDGRGLAAVERGEGVGEEGFPRDSREERATEDEKVVLAVEEGVVFCEAFAEAVTRIEHD
jgi:hypothetical protein